MGAKTRWAEAAVEKQLARLRFVQLRARAAKGRWTGPTETREDGGQTVSGEFRMGNGWSFADCDATRGLTADAIAELDQRP